MGVFCLDRLGCHLGHNVARVCGDTDSLDTQGSGLCSVEGRATTRSSGATDPKGSQARRDHILDGGGPECLLPPLEPVAQPTSGKGL